MIGKYVKRPVEIEAVEFTPNSIEECLKFIHGYIEDVDSSIIDHVHRESAIYIDTLEGRMKACFGDYIIKGVKGEFYPCKPDVFLLTYQSKDS